jgi:hypothetical protein
MIDDVFIIGKGDDDANYYELHLITDGENEGNCMAIAKYGVDPESGADLYEYKYVVVDDFRNEETEGRGLLRGDVKLAVNGGEEWFIIN